MVTVPTAAPQPHCHCHPQSCSCSWGWCYCTHSSLPALVGPVCASWPSWPLHSSLPAHWPVVPLVHAGWPSLATICVGWPCRLLFSPPPFACIHTCSCRPTLICMSIPLFACLRSFIPAPLCPIGCAGSHSPLFVLVCAHSGLFRPPSLSFVLVSNT